MPHRYHARVLRTPTQVRRARFYVRTNRVHHGDGMNPNLRDPFSSQADPSVPQARTWLLREGWRRGRASAADPWPAW